MDTDLSSHRTMRLFSCCFDTKGATRDERSPSQPGNAQRAPATEALPRWNGSATEYDFAVAMVCCQANEAMLEVDDSGSVRLHHQSPDDDRKPSASYMKALGMSTGSQHLTNGAPTEAAYLEGLCMAAASDPALGTLLACATAFLQLGKPFSREHELAASLPSAATLLFGQGIKLTIRTASWDGPLLRDGVVTDAVRDPVPSVVLVHVSTHPLQTGDPPSDAAAALQQSSTPQPSLTLQIPPGPGDVLPEDLSSGHRPLTNPPDALHTFPASAGVDSALRSPSAQAHPEASTARTLSGASFLVDHVPAMVSLCYLDGRVAYQVRGLLPLVTAEDGGRRTGTTHL